MRLTFCGESVTIEPGTSCRLVPWEQTANPNNNIKTAPHSSPMLNLRIERPVMYGAVPLQSDVQEAEPKNTYYENLYRTYNPVVLVAHAANLGAALYFYFQQFQKIPDNYVFVSPAIKLHWTSHALLLQHDTENKCGLEIPPTTAQKVYPDFMKHELYNFKDKYLIEYDKGGGQFPVIWSMCAFFALSLLFQLLHYSYLRTHRSMPRVLHYVEYAFSASLMIMVLAINVGIIELFAVTGFCAAFYGMNMLGAAAEGLCHYLGHVPADHRPTAARLIWLFHLAGWVLFFLALVPIWVQLNTGIKCTDGGSPGFVIAAVAIESVCFFLFGFLQVMGLRQKIKESAFNREPNTELLFKYDCLHALLSLTAKTLLAWLLMGPAASVDVNIFN